MKQILITQKKMREARHALAFLQKWQEIEAIIKNRKSAFDINEYLILSKHINFD